MKIFTTCGPGRWRRSQHRLLLLLGILLLAPALHAQLYWTGANSTLWNDVGNWSTNAGTVVLPSNPPTSLDDVVFNQLGAYTVDIDLLTATCKSFSVNPGANITVNSLSSNVELWVHGDFILHSNVNWNYNGLVYFKASTAVTIDPALNYFIKRIYFDDPSGSFNVVSKLLSYDNVVHRFGTLTLNDGGEFGGYFSNFPPSTSTRVFNLSNSANNLKLNNSFIAGDQWSYPWNSKTGLVLNQGNSIEIEFAGTEAYLFAQELSFNIVRMTHSNNNFIGNARVEGLNGNQRNQFNLLSCMGNASIVNDNQINGLLELTNGGLYQFTSGTKQDFVNSGAISFLTGPPCSYAILEATGDCTPAIFDQLIGQPMLMQGALKNIITQNSTPNIQIGLGIDMGGNSGWTFPGAPTAQTFVWTGSINSNWHEPGNWTGGTVGCIPSPIDNVRFIGAPTNPVQVALPVAQCSSMDWSGATGTWSFSSLTPSNLLIVYGDQVMPSPTNINNQGFQGELRFAGRVGSTTVNNIFSNGYQWRNDIHFAGCGGSWKTQDQFETVGFGTTISSSSGGIIYLDKGSLDISGQTVRALSFNSRNSNPRTLHMLSSTIELTGNENPYYGAYAWDFTDGHGQNGLTMQYGNNVSGSHIHLNGNASLNAPYASGQILHKVTFHSIGRMHGSNIFRHNVHFKSDGTIGYPANPTSSAATNIFRRQLRLEPGKAYIVEVGEEQFFNGNNSTIVTNGSCAAYTQIRSSQPNGLTRFTNNSAGTITLDYCILKDLDATFGSHPLNFQCNNTFGFNLSVVPTNWNISAPTSPPVLYWIGGNQSSISWSDPNNWSLTSGGAPNPSGCTPSPVTDAVFDENGFNYNTPGSYIVEVDICNAYVHNMRWELNSTSGVNVEFRDNNQVANLWVYGYWDMCNQTSCGNLITNNYDAAISFETDGDLQDEIAMDPPLVFKSDLYFRGVGKTWVQRTDITTTKDEWLIAGRHFTAEKNLTVDQFTGYDAGILDLSDLIKPTFTLTGTATNVPNRHTFQSFDGFQLFAGESEMVFTNGVRPSIRPEHGLTFWNVTFTDVSTYAELYADNGLNTFNKLTFLGSASIFCDNDYLTELRFSPAKTYVLESGVTQHFVGAADFKAIGNNPDYIKILARTTGSETYFLKDQPHVCLNWVSLRDCHNISQPGIIFSAGPNSINWNNNLGWTFAVYPLKGAADCYAPTPVTICDQMPFTFVGEGPASSIVSWNWNFGNGNTSTLQHPTTTYNTPGSYLVHCDVVYTSGIHNRFLYEMDVDNCCQPGGNSVWPVQGGVFSQSFESGNDVDVDHYGNVYICGQNEFNANFSSTVLTNVFGFAASYDNCGQLRWAVSLQGEPIARRLKVSPANNKVYVITDNGLNGVDVIALDASTGALAWSFTIGANGGATAGSIDAFGDNVYACGSFTGSLSVPTLSPITSASTMGTSGFLVVFNTSSFTWTARALDPLVGTDAVTATGIAAHINGNITVVGQGTGSLNFCTGGISPCFHSFPGPSQAYLAQFDPSLVHHTSRVELFRNNYLEVEYDFINEQTVVINGNTSPAFVDAYDGDDYSLPMKWTDMGAANEFYEDIHVNNGNGHAGVFVSGRLHAAANNDLSMVKKWDVDGNSIYGPLTTTNWTPYLGSTGKGVATTREGHLMYMTGTFSETTLFGPNYGLLTSGAGDYDVYTTRVYEEISTAQFYKLDLTGVAENPEASLTVSPNPTTGEVNVEIILPQEEEITIQLVDFYGRVILERNYGRMNTRTVMLNLSGQASGIYYLQVRSDQRNLSQKVILAD